LFSSLLCFLFASHLQVHRHWRGRVGTFLKTFGGYENEVAQVASNDDYFDNDASHDIQVYLFPSPWV
jgi:hypothetical protein